MKCRKWTGKEKLQIVLEGMRGQDPLGNFARGISSANRRITNGGINCLTKAPKSLFGVVGSKPSSGCARKFAASTRR